MPADADTAVPSRDSRDRAQGPSPGQLKIWRAAQSYELAWWQRRGVDDLRAQGERFARGADALSVLLDAHAANDWRRSVLQVGTAGVAEIHHLPVRTAFAVEPLARALDAGGLLVRGDVRFVCAMGERLPFGDERFSLALAPNVIDHVAAPALVLAELHRCLEPGGLLWLSSHVSPRWAIPAFRLLRASGIGYFAGHPWYFAADRLRELALAAGFEIRLDHAGEVAEVEGKESAPLRTRLKRRLLGVRYLLLERAPIGS